MGDWIRWCRQRVPESWVPTLRINCNTPHANIFPLKHASDDDLKNLCRVLWGWEACLDCGTEGTCPINDCPWRRFLALSHYLKVYKATTSWCIPENLFEEQHALRSHKDLSQIIQLIKDRPDDPFSQLVEDHFVTYTEKPSQVDQLRAFHLAIRNMIMIQCSLKESSLVRWKPGFAPIIWKNEDSVRNLIARTFRKGNPLNLKDEFGSTIGLQLSARRLKSVHGVQFRGTDELRRHLILDSEKKIIYFFHHTAFLKEHLIRTQGDAADSWEIVIRGLALEILDSLQNVVFPFDDGSRELLSSLVAKDGLDPDCARLDAVGYRRDGETDLRYHYLGTRMMKIYHEFERPKSSGGLARQWWYARSGPPYILLWTIGGILVTVLFTTAAFSVQIFQTHDQDKGRDEMR